LVETDHGRGRGHGRHAGEPKRYGEGDQEVSSIPNPIRPAAMWCECVCVCVFVFACMCMDMCIAYQCIKCMEACRCTGICLFIGKTSREDDRMFSRQIRSRKAVSNICMGATKHAHAYRGLALTPEEITDYERWS